MRGNPAIEYFLWTQDKAKQKLVYYDQNGNYFEKSVDPKVLESVLKYFDGRPRSVERSSGGRILVQPYQVIILDQGENPDSTPDIRIRVRFRDLKRNERHEVISQEIVMNTKTVLPSELQEPFSYENETAQNFVADFGRGIIPLHVFDYHYDQTGQIIAKFVRVDELEKAISDPAGAKIQVSIYEMPRDVLRSVGANQGGNQKDFETAKAHATRLLLRGDKLIPDCLATGEHVTLPTGSTISLLRQFLKVSCKGPTPEQPEMIYVNVPNPDEELLPFGTLEES